MTITCITTVPDRGGFPPSTAVSTNECSPSASRSRLLFRTMSTYLSLLDLKYSFALSL
uniref:Uncharacterized protein n=1 Tax=Pygocentrus nattereri TaxID=42514 RepID=A0A3B4ED96_PYGNA